MKRKILIGTILLLSAYIIGVFGKWVVYSATTPPWVKDLGPPHQTTISLNDIDLAESQKTRNYIKNELLYAKNWDDEQVNQLIMYIDSMPTPSNSIDYMNEDTDLVTKWMIRDEALFTIGERFRVHAPIEDRLIQPLVDRLTEGMYQEHDLRYRSSSVADTIHAGLADTPGPIRDHLLFMVAHPDEFIDLRGISEAENIKRQLTARGTFKIEGEN